MANVLAELTEQLAKRVGGDDIAKGMIEMIQAEGGTRSTVQRKIRNLLKSYDASDAIVDAKDAANTKLMSNFVEDSDGQMTLLETTQRAPKEARVSNFAEGSDGQMHIVGAEPNRPVNNDVEGQISISDYQNSLPTEGQQSFVVDEYGNLNSDYGIQQQQIRKAEVDKANRTWRRKKLDDISDGASRAWTGVKNTAAATGDKASRAWAGVKNIFTGEGDAANRISGRKTREAERVAANEEYIITGNGSAQSKKDYRKNRKGNSNDIVESTDNAVNNDTDTNMSGLDKHGIPGWAKTAGLLTAGVVAGFVLDDDDEEY